MYRSTPAPDHSSPLRWATEEFQYQYLTATARTLFQIKLKLTSILVNTKQLLQSSQCNHFSWHLPGIDIKDIPNVNDRDFSITLNGFFLVRWRDPRLIIENVDFEENESLIPVDVSLVDSIWMPDIEILNLKEFATLDVLSKLEGLWLNKDLELIYAVACRITWICPMTFDSFPLDVQVINVFLAININQSCIV